MNNINKILQDFENYIIGSLETWQTPGLVVGIVKDNEVIYKKTFGVKRAGVKDPIDTQTNFQIGSITKGFTATLMAILAAEKKIKWQDKVIDFLPEFRMYDPWITREFTIEDCFTHRTGLPPAAGLNLLSFGFDQDHLIHSLRYIKPDIEFSFCLLLSKYTLSNSR